MTIPMRARRLAGHCALLATISIVIAGAPARADMEDDPFSMVRDEQMVTGAAKRPQPLSETPSAVTVVTAEEIRAHGYRTVGEVLRWVRGVFVTYDRNYSYVGMRGLQRPGDYNNKILLTIDGHSMNGNVYDDGLFGNELGLDLETVERIEVVRGPGSALYGSSAVLAVVNVVTRRPSRDPGVTLGGWSGTGAEHRGYAGIASSRPGRPEWSLNGSWLGARGADLYFPEFNSPLSHDGLAVDADGEDARAFFGTAEWAGLRLSAKVNDRMKRVPTGAFGTTFGDRRSRTYDGHDFVEIAGSRQLSSAFELNGRLYWDGARYRAFYAYGPDSATYINFDNGDGDLFGTEWRGHWSPSAGEVVTFGAEGQLHSRVDLINYDLDPYTSYIDLRQRRHALAAYVENERRLGGAATVTAGMRVDGTHGFDPVVSPRLDVVWRSAPGLSWKLLGGSAFRAPSFYETDYEDGRTLRNPGIGPERVVTLEAGMVRGTAHTTWTVSTYANRIRGLIDLMQIDSVTQTFTNRERVQSRGVETELEVVRTNGMRVRTALAWQTSFDEDNHTELTNSPRWNGHVSLTHAPAEGRISLGLGTRVLSPRRTLGGALTGWAGVTDARLGLRFAHAAELGFEARNIFDSRYGDPGSGEHRIDQIQQDGRTLSVTFTVHPPFHP